MLPAIVNDSDFLPFQFEGIKLQEACFINGNPYFTRKAIGEFLEYSPKTLDRAVAKIIERNPHIKQFSVLVNLTSTDGKKYDQEIYDPIGLQLIIFESRQPKALQYKVAVAHLVYAFHKGEIKPSKWASNRISAIKQILSYPPVRKRKELIIDLAQREGVTPGTVYNWIEKIGELKTHKGTKRRRSDKGKTKYPELKAKAIEIKAQNPDYGYKKIASLIGKPEFKENIKRWLKAA